MLTQGLITALAVLWLLSYLPLRRVFGYAFAVDIIITGTLMWMFAGSYGGMMTAVISGMILSMFLRTGALLFGAERLTVARRQGAIIPEPVWRKVR